MSNTYSFADVSVVISHPSVGRITATGQGLGSVNISMTTDGTAHDVAADGVVMASKIRARNGLVAITVQQTSEVNKWFMKWSNYLETASSSEWTDTTVVVRSSAMKETTVATGVSPAKRADKPYQAQGQMVTWNLMCTDIQQDPV